MTWSYSRLAAFERCHEQHYRSYEADDPEDWEPEVFGVGRRFHTGAEQYAKHCFDAGVPQDSTRALEIAAGLATYDADLGRLFEAWAARTEFDWAATHATPEGVEMWVARCLPDDDGTLRGEFRGRVDRVEWDPDTKRLWFTDYKTSWQPPPFDPDEPPLQVLAYAWALQWEYQTAEQMLARVEYVRRPKMEPHEWTLVPPLDWAQAALVERVDEVRNRPEKYARELSPGSHCGSCPYLLSCRVDEEAPQVVRNAEEAAAGWQFAEALQQKASALKKAAGQQVADGGPVEIGEKRLDFWPPSYANSRGDVLAVRPGSEIELLRQAQSFGADVRKLVSFKGAALMKLVEHAEHWDPMDFLEEAEGRVTLAARKLPKEAGDAKE